VTLPADGQPATQTPASPYRTALRPAVWAATFWILGELCGFEWGGSLALLSAGALGAGIIATIATIRAKRGIVGLATLALLCVLLGWARVALWQESRPNPVVLSRFLNQRVAVSGILSTTPEPRSRIWRFGISADTLASEEGAAIGSVDVFVRMDMSLGAPRIGERVRLVGMMNALPRLHSPGTLDYGRYLEYRGYSATLSVYDSAGFAPLPLQRDAWTAFWDRARSYVKHAITVGMPEDAAGLAAGLILGERHGLSRKTMEEFSACGVIHILSVSGFHVAIVLVGIGVPLRRFCPPGVWQALVLIAFAWCYSQLSGNDPPMVRSCIMATVFLLAFSAERKFDPWNALALSALVTLFFVPTALFDIGFQLSYAAMIGLMAFGSLTDAKLKKVSFIRNHAWVRYPIGLAVATIAAQITTAPLVAHYIMRMSLLAMIGNLPITALVSVGIWASVAAALLGWLPYAAVAINAVNARVLDAVLNLGSWFAAMPYASTWLRPPTWPEMLVYGACAYAVWWVSSKKGLLKGAVVALLLFANAGVWWAWLHRPTETEIAFLNVGQGDATVCRFADGHTVLIDGGPATPWHDAGDWVVVPYLRSRGIERVDAVVVTHGDNDHVGGLTAVLRAMEVGALWYGGADTSATFQSLVAAARRRGVPMHQIGAGDSIAGLSGASMEVLFPPRDSVLSSSLSDNDRSAVLRLIQQGDTLLFTGDAGVKTERLYLPLLREETGARADVLRVGHHGSKYATGDSLLASLRPRFGVVSVGRNRYGHPAKETVARLKAHGVRIIRTDEDGTVIRQIDENGGRWAEAE
jgi:competence protein ComEC